MKTLFRTICATVGACLSVAGSALALDGWIEDFAQGMATASAEGRVALVEFTGTDWCFYCIKLRENVLPTEEFAEFTKKNNLVLIELDFPRAKDKVTPEQSAERDRLAKLYNVQGFPTMLVVDGYGQPYGRIVGGASSAAEYIKRLQSALDVKAAYDEKVAAADKLTGKERMEALQAALNVLPQDCRALHTKLQDAIIESDPEDSTGLRKKKEEQQLLDKQIAETKDAVQAALKGRKLADALPEARAAALEQLKRDDLLPFIRLSMNAFVSQTFLGEEKYEEALSYMDAAIESAPDSPEADKMRKGRKDLVEYIEKQKKAGNK